MDDEYTNRRIDAAEDNIGQLKNAIISAQNDLQSLYQEMGRMGSNLDHAGEQIGMAIEKAGNAVLKMIDDSTSNLQQGLNDISYFSGRVELAKQLSEFSSVKATLKVQRGALEKEIFRISKKQSGIKNKYESQKDTILSLYKRDIRQLGKHIFEILENDFVNCVENRLIASKINNYGKVNKQISTKRKNKIENQINPCASKVSDFKDQRDKFRESINHNSIKKESKGKNHESEQINIDFWQIKRSDNEEVHFLPPSTVIPTKKSIDNDDHHVFFKIENLKKFSIFFESIKPKMKVLKKSNNAVPLNKDELNKICDAISKMAESRQISDVFSDRAKRMIIENPPLLTK